MYPSWQLWSTFKKKNTQTEGLTSHEMQINGWPSTHTIEKLEHFFCIFFLTESSIMVERNHFSTKQILGMPSYSFWRLIINCGQQQYPAAGWALSERQKDLLCPKSCSCFTGITLLLILGSFLKKLPQSNKHKHASKWSRHCSK